MLSINNVIKLLRNNKNIEIDSRLNESYALYKGIIFISRNNYSGNINFKIKDKKHNIEGSGKIISIGSTIINYKERGIILYKNPEDVNLVNENYNIYKIIFYNIIVDNNNYKIDLDNLNEKQYPFLKSTRPWSFQQSIAAVLIGTILAIHINLFYFILDLLAIILAQASFNVINGYYDYKSGNDKLSSMTSTRVFIDKIIDEKKALNIALVMLFLSIITGIYLIYFKHILIVFLLIGIFSGIVYSLPKYGFKRLAMGDLSVFIIWGPGIFVGSYILQNGIVNIPVILLSFSIGLLTTNIVHSNNWRDIKDDSKNNIKTVSILLKNKGSKIYYLLLLWIPYVLIFSAYVLNKIYYPALFSFITLPLAYKISINVIKNNEKYINILDGITAKFTMFFAISVFLAYFIIYSLNGLLYLHL